MDNKKIGYIGLGKMGFGMVERMIEKGYSVVANNRSSEPVDRAASVGAIGAYSIPELIEKLPAPRTVWVMVSHQAVDEILSQIVPLLEKGDTIIEGGNSPYFETIRRAQEITEKGINFLDAGVSGGPSGARNGACIMVGGDADVYKKYEQLFKDLSVENGFNHFGKNGAGHFVKMVHNGIEYGMMQAIGEGFDVMKNADKIFGESLDLEKISSLYNRGSVIESRLVGWLNNAYKKHGLELNDISGEVNASGEGEWTVRAGKELGVPVQVIEDSLEFRKKSKGNPTYTGKVVSALRNEFGGHEVSDKK